MRKEQNEHSESLSAECHVTESLKEEKRRAFSRRLEIYKALTRVSRYGVSFFLPSSFHERRNEARKCSQKHWGE